MPFNKRHKNKTFKPRDIDFTLKQTKTLLMHCTVRKLIPVGVI